MADECRLIREYYYFTLPTEKLIVFNVLTFGLYNIYWFYKNWHQIRLHENIDVRPVWRSMFYYIFCYSCFRKIKRSADKNGIPNRFSPAACSVLLVLCLIIGNFPLIWVLGYFAIIPMYFANKLAIKINQAVIPYYWENRLYTRNEIIVLAISLASMALTILGVFVPS